MKKIKFSPIQIGRLLVQIASFIFLPALFIGAFAGIKTLYVSIITQTFHVNSLLLALIPTMVLIPATIIVGRFFCGWMCAFGSLGEWIYMLSNKVLKVKFKMPQNIDRILKYFKYILLVFLVAVIWTFNITIFSTWNPWDVFGMTMVVGQIPEIPFVITSLTIGFILLLLILIGSFFIERFFCRYLCPLGAIFALTSKLKIIKIKKPHAKCGKCKLCTVKCAMGIDLNSMDTVNNGECIQCMKCISVCPIGNAKLKVAQTDIQPLVAGIGATAVMSGLYYAGNFGVNASTTTIANVSSTSSQSMTTTVTSKNTNSTTSSAVTAAGTYTDGTYTGSGKGYRGTTTVSVTISGGKITDITTVSTNDDKQYYNRAYDVVILQIMNQQSSKVQAVSGATYSSNGIMSAVANALTKA